MTLKQRFSIRGKTNIQEIGTVELSEDLNNFSLGGCLITELLITDAPGLGHSSRSIEQTDKSISLGIQARILVVHGVFKDMPHPASKVLSKHTNR